MNWKQVSACHQWVCDGEMLLLCAGLLTMAAGWKLFRLWLAVWLAVTVLAFYTASQYRRLSQGGPTAAPQLSRPVAALVPSLCTVRRASRRRRLSLCRASGHSYVI